MTASELLINIIAGTLLGLFLFAIGGTFIQALQNKYRQAGIWFEVAVISSALFYWIVVHTPTLD